MKLFEAFGLSGYHTTIATTFAIDFEAFEMIALGRLREVGCMNNIVVADCNMLTWSLEDGQRLPAQAGRQYSLVAASAGKLFHPKLTLQIGEDRARLIVASANLTASGLGGNLEVAGELRMEPGDPSLAPLMREAFEFLVRHVPETEEAAHKQLEWARSRATWLAQAPLHAAAVESPRLLATDPSASIGQRFVDEIGGAAVSRLIVVSPYWDEKLGALRWLQKALKPRKTALLIQPARALFPGSIELTAQIFSIGNLGAKRERFAHAKVLIAQSRSADHVLFGSANCTMAALGGGIETNVEASLYVRMAPGAAIAGLELEGILAGSPLKGSEIVPYVGGDNIPLKEVAERQPGRFQLRGTALTWIPSAAFSSGEVVLELLGLDQQVVETINAAPVDPGITSRRALKISSAPIFARVRAGSRRSAIGVIQREEDLLNNLRVATNSKIQRGLDKLRGAESPGSFLYEALEFIDSEELKFAAAARSTRGRRRRGGEQAAPSQTLTYGEFMKARRSGPPPDHVAGNTLASSYVNEVRVTLNTLLDDGEARAPTVDESALGQTEIPLGLGDETEDGEEALEAGNYDEREADSGPAAAPPPPALSRPEPDCARTICEVVARFIKRISDRSSTREWTTRDLFRVRVLLTVILTAGSNQAVRRPAAPGEPRAVLAARGEEGWPRLAAQVLFCLFSKESPAIHRVKVELDGSGHVPVDILECFATCMWTLAALALARDDRSTRTEVAARASMHTADVYGMTILEPELMRGQVVMKLMGLLSNRCAARLGVDPEALTAFHAQMVEQAQIHREIWLAASCQETDEEVLKRHSA